jgi:hypothetical protein
MAGCARPLTPRCRKSSGFTTIPSPPFAAISVHHAMPSASLAGSASSTTLYRVASRMAGSAWHTVASVSMCQVCGRSVWTLPSLAMMWNLLIAEACAVMRETTASSLAFSSPFSRAPDVASDCTTTGVDARPAEPTAAYWLCKSACAFADHGISSQSRQSQVVLSWFHNSAVVIAARRRSSSWRSSAASLKNLRPVRVVMMPTSPVSMPNRSRAADSSLQSTATAREPMCFSSHTTRITPWLR